MLSQGIRIYTHQPNGEKIERECYNFHMGMDEIVDIEMDPSFVQCAVGSEEGAMVAHYRWKN